MKRTIIYIFFVFLVGVGIYCLNIYSGKSTNEIKYDNSNEVLNLTEVHKCVMQDLDNCKKRSNKLKFEDIIPYCPDVKTVSDIHYSLPDYYKEIKSEKDMLSVQIPFIEKLLGAKMTELNFLHFQSGYDELIKQGKYKDFLEFMSDDKENENREPQWLAYLEQDEKHLQYAEIVNPLFKSVVFNRGKCYELNYENRMKEQDGLTMLTQPRFVCEKVAEYYVYGNQGELDKTWKLSDGEISVKDGVQFAEEYLENLLELDGESEDVKLKVAYVEVYQISDTVFAFRYKMRRSIDEVLCQTLDAGSSVSSPSLNYDMIDAYQVETDTIDMYQGPTKIFRYTKTNQTDAILPLGKAIELLEKSLGDNSNYCVYGVELGYLNTYVDSMTQEEGNATVCWYFNCVNEQDNALTEFYVNARTGDIKTYTRYSG